MYLKAFGSRLYELTGDKSVNRDTLIEEAKQFIEQEESNYITSEIAISEKVVGLKDKMLFVSSVNI